MHRLPGLSLMFISWCRYVKCICESLCSSMASFSQGHGATNIRALMLGAALLLLAACGGPGGGEPTALPPDVARPVQPDPRYPAAVGPFTRVTPPAPRFVETTPVTVPGTPVVQTRVVSLPVAQRPTALGIVHGAAALLDRPDGASLRTLAAGTSVTVTGLNGAETHYAVFTADGAPGWIAASRLTLYGGDDLETVARAMGPGPVATMIADAMVPIEPSVLDAVEEEGER